MAGYEIKEIDFKELDKDIIIHDIIINASSEHSTKIKINLPDNESLIIYTQPDYIEEPKVFISLGKD